jgi:hypothetical protein
MPRDVSVRATHAPQGQRMIEVKIRFWTNDIADGDGMIYAKHAWASGVVRMQSNHSHEIVPSDPVPFHSLLDIGRAIEKTLIDNEIVLHPPRRMKKYFND